LYYNGSTADIPPSTGWIVANTIYNDPPTSVILPVDFGYFKAQLNEKENQISLNWQTLMELNNKGFEIEHSIDGKEFKTLDFVEGVGTTADAQVYNYEHKDFQKGENYYRLKQLDLDGEYDYSEVVLVSIKKEGTIALFPNPAKHSVYIDMPENLLRREVNINIHDVTGRLFYEQTQELETSRIRLNLKDIPAGSYFVRVKHKKESYSELLIIN
jgi:hypothetical protein